MPPISQIFSKVGPLCPAYQSVFLRITLDQVDLKLQNNFPINCREGKSRSKKFLSSPVPHRNMREVDESRKNSMVAVRDLEQILSIKMVCVSAASSSKAVRARITPASSRQPVT